MCGPTGNSDQKLLAARAKLEGEFREAYEKIFANEGILSPRVDDEWGSEKVSRTFWNAQIFGETRRQLEATELLKHTKAGYQAKLQKYAGEHLALVREQLAAFAGAGVDLSQYADVRNELDLSPEQRVGLLLCPPTLVAMPNGQTEADNVGVYLVPWDVLANAKLQKDILGAGEFIPTGAPLSTALTVIQKAKNDIGAKQKALFVRAFKKIDTKSEASSEDPSPVPQIT